MIDHGYILHRLKTLSSRTALTDFNAFYSRWICAFDASIYVYVDSGSKLSADLMKQELHEVDSKLCTVPCEAPRGIGLNERTRRYLQKSIDGLLLQNDYDTGQDHEILLDDIEIGWNHAKHANNILPRYHRLGIMPRL